MMRGIDNDKCIIHCYFVAVFAGAEPPGSCSVLDEPSGERYEGDG